jgi:hypothetical protein
MFSDQEVFFHGKVGRVRILYRVIDDLNSNARFMAFYTPEYAATDPQHPTALTMEVLSIIALRYKSLMTDLKKYAIMGGPGMAQPESTKSLPFSGKLYIYYCDPLSIEEMADVTKLFREHGAQIEFRGLSYRSVVNDNIKRGLTARPQQFVMSDKNLPVPLPNSGKAPDFSVGPNIPSGTVIDVNKR